MSRVRLLAATAATGLCLLAAAPAIAQQGPPSNPPSPPGNPPGQGIGTQCPNPGGAYPVGQRCTGTTSDSTMGPDGGQMTVGTPPVFIPGENVNGTGRSTPFALGTFTAAPSGRVTGTVTIPAGLEPGPHRLEFTGLASGQFVAIPFTVSGVRGRAAGAAGLSSTGTSSTVPLVATGAGMVLVGSLVVATARRRRSPGLAA